VAIDEEFLCHKLRQGPCELDVGGRHGARELAKWNCNDIQPHIPCVMIKSPQDKQTGVCFKERYVHIHRNLEDAEKVIIVPEEI
jgi:hypothetical protein